MSSVKSNYIWNSLYSVVNVLLPFITTPYLARTLGAEAIGQNSYVAANVSYFLLIAVLGTTLYGHRQIATVKNNKYQLSRSFKEILLFRITTTMISFVGFAALLQFGIQYKELYYIYILSFANVILDISWFYKGIEDFKKITLRNFAVRIIHTILIFVFIKTPNDLWLYVLFSASCTIIGNGSMWISLKGKLIKTESVKPFKNTKGIVLLFLPTIASQVYILLDRSMMGWINGSTYQIGCYEETEKLIRIAISIIESPSMVMLSRVAFLYKGGKEDAAIEYVYKAYRFAIMLALPMVFGLIAVTERLVPVFWGVGFDYIYRVLPILCLMLPITSISSVTGYSLLIPIGKQNIYTIAISCTAVTNIVLNYILISLMGGVGAAIASVISEVVGMTIQLAWCNRHGIINVWKIVRFSWKYIVSSAVMLIVVKVFFAGLRGGVFTLLLVVVVGVFSYSAGLFLLRDDFFFVNVKSTMLSLQGKFFR